MKKYSDGAPVQGGKLTPKEWGTALAALCIYLVQFLLLPRMVPRYYPQTNEAAAILLIPLLLLTVAGVLLGLRIRGWVLVDGTYALAVMLYNGPGLYGIGLRGVRLDGMVPVYDVQLALLMVGILVVTMALLQLLLSGLSRLLRRLFKAQKST